MKFFLLTHERETSKKTNTGQLVTEVLEVDGCQRVIWQRKEPNAALLKAISDQQAVLLSTQGDGPEIIWEKSTLLTFEFAIIIDSTWQQSKKIYRQSPYLHQLPWVKIAATEVSTFNLRRNQVQGGLCTAESVIAYLRVLEMRDEAEALQVRYESFLTQ